MNAPGMYISLMHIYAFLLHGLPVLVVSSNTPRRCINLSLFSFAWRLEAICFVCFVFGSFSSDVMSLSILRI